MRGPQALSCLAPDRVGVGFGRIVCHAVGDRLEEPVVTFTEDVVLVELTASRLDGFRNCQGITSQRVEIELAEPLGERDVKEATATDLGDSP